MCAKPKREHEIEVESVTRTATPNSPADPHRSAQMLASVTREQLRSMCREVVRSSGCTPHPSESTKSKSNLFEGRLRLTLPQTPIGVTREHLRRICRDVV